MTTNGTGLYYEIYQTGTGKNPIQHQQVSVSYKLFLIDGTLCYTIDEMNPLHFKIGEGTQMRGLEDAMMFMKEGDRARLVIPSHLAFGMNGDGNKIPGGSPLYIDIHLIKVSE